jgi:ADP-ribose pyrophosphatase YjhB (NUDIX family)
MKRTTRYQAAIVEHDRILLLKVIDYNHGTVYWVIPGGGQEADETEEQCVQREVLEETCLRVEVVRLILDEPGIDDDIYQRSKTYLCRVIGGEVKPGCEPEVDTADFTTIQEVGWFDLRDPGSWDALALNDPITYPLLQRIRSVLGYLPQTAVSSA